MTQRSLVRRCAAVVDMGPPLDCLNGDEAAVGSIIGQALGLGIVVIATHWGKNVRGICSHRDEPDEQDRI
jgi:hypothetical protein